MSAFTNLMSNIFSGLQGKIPVRGTLTTPSGGETFPIAICNEIKGGPFIVNNIDELKTIPFDRLLLGCKCTVNEYIDGTTVVPTTTYQLKFIPTFPDDFQLVQDPSGDYYVLENMESFWVLDRPQQAETGTLQYQYSPNYENKKPLFLPTEITKEAYQAGYATTEAYNTSDTTKLIWESTYNSATHKWVRQKTSEAADWGIPVSLSQNYASGDYIDTLYQWTPNSNGNPTEPATPSSMKADGQPNNTPAGWEDTPEIPGGISYETYILTNSLWQISATKEVYGNLKSNWSRPLLISTDPNLVRYGMNYNASFDPMSSEWHPFYESGDIFKASRPDINSNVWTVEKISGESGEYTDYVFKEFIVGRNPRPEEDPTASPKTVLGYGTDGWQDAVFTPQQGYNIYVSTCRKYSDGTQSTAWSVPAKYNGESTVRAVIEPGTSGTTFKYSTLNGVKSVTPNSIELTVVVYDGKDVVDYGNISNIKWYKDNVLIPNQSAYTLTISDSDVSNSSVYSVEVTYRTEIYKDQINIVDTTDGVGYVVTIFSSTGFTYKGVTTKTFDAKVYENGVDITSSSNLTFTWLLNGSPSPNVSVDTRHVTLDQTHVVGIANLELAVKVGTAPDAVTYKCAETLTDVVDGVSLVRYYTTQEQQPNPLTPPAGTIPITGISPLTTGTVWTTNSAGAIWVVERPSNVNTWNASYRVKGEMGVPNGGFQKTVYKVVAGDPPTTPATPTKKTSGTLTPDGWLDTPPASINVGETTFGSQAMFTKNPSNSNMTEDVANWDTTSWSAPFKLTTSFVGGTGPAGTNGTNGWTPQFKLEDWVGYDGSSSVPTKQLHLWTWTGGEGTMPTIGYLTSTGLSPYPTLGGNIKGDKGPTGVFNYNSYWSYRERIIFTGLELNAQLTLELYKATTGMVFWTCYGRGYDPEGYNTITKILPLRYKPTSNCSQIDFIHFVTGGDGKSFPSRAVFYTTVEGSGFRFLTETHGSRAINVSGSYYAGTAI